MLMFKYTLRYLNSDCQKLLVKTMNLSVSIEAGMPRSLKTLSINACNIVCTTNGCASGMK